MSAAEYRARFRRVLEHADAHLDEPLSVEQLSAVAAFSKFHFHRQFTALFGLGVYEYVQLVRLKRAAHELAYRAERSIVRIALDSGYDSPEAFGRAFKKRFKQTPSAFRSAPDWRTWDALFQPLRALRTEHMKTTHKQQDVKIIEFERTPVAALEHRAAAAQIGESVRRFIEWRKAQRLSPRTHATFNIWYGEPGHMDICVATNEAVSENTYGIVNKVIPAGRCAVLRHLGSDDLLEQSMRYLYAEWLPESGEQPGAFPLFGQRVAFFPDVPEHEAITDLFLPLAPRS